MAWQDAAISVLSIVFLISHAIYSAITASLAAIAQLGLFILRLASWSISSFYNTLLFVFAPVIYTIRFVLTPFFYVFNRLPRLEPLYIYFGSAAFVGVTFGLILMLTSNSMFAVLGLYDSPDEEKAKGGRNNGTRSHGDGSSRRQAPSSSSYYPGDEEEEEEAGLPLHRHQQQPTTPLLLDSSEQERLDALLSTLGYPDSDMGGLAMHGWRDSPNIKRKRRSAAASRIGTILEEDDDSF